MIDRCRGLPRTVRDDFWGQCTPERQRPQIRAPSNSRSPGLQGAASCTEYEAISIADVKGGNEWRRGLGSPTLSSRGASAQVPATLREQAGSQLQALHVKAARSPGPGREVMQPPFPRVRPWRPMAANVGLGCLGLLGESTIGSRRTTRVAMNVEARRLARNRLHIPRGQFHQMHRQ